MEIEEIIKNFVDDFCALVWEKLKKYGVKGVGVTGSYGRGDWSKSRPDINFAIFTDKETPGLLLGIGQVASDLNEEYSLLVNLRPDIHPERIVFPWGRDRNKVDLFFKIAIFDLKYKDLTMPFGRPGVVMEGHKKSIKMWHGKNYFEEVKISSSNEEVIKGCHHVLSQWARSIKLTPLSYNLNKDTDLFFNESLSWGKIAILHFAWIQGIKNGLDYSKAEDRVQIFEKVNKKEGLSKFLNIPQKERKMVDLILEARLNYDKWKNNKELSRRIYAASDHLLNFFLNEAKKFLE